MSVYIMNKLKAEISELKAQRDELLEALELIIDSGEIAYCYSSPLVILAKKAIAKAKGEAND